MCGILFSIIILICTSCTNSANNENELSQFHIEDYVKYYFFVSIHRQRLIDVNGDSCGDYSAFECLYDTKRSVLNDNSYSVSIITPNGCEYFSDHGDYGIYIENHYFKLLSGLNRLDSMSVYKEEINFLAKWKVINLNIRDTVISNIASHRYNKIFQVDTH